MALKMDTETLRLIMTSMTTNDRALQRATLERYVTGDVAFTHPLGDVRGRDAFFGVYRAAVTGIDYDLRFIECVVADGAAAVWVDLNLKLAPFYLRRYHAPTVVLLKFRRCEDGLLRICEQVDHHSLFVFMWAMGWPLSALWDCFVRPVGGFALSRAGWAVDAAQDAAAAAWALAARAAAAVLPAPLLHALLWAAGGRAAPRAAGAGAQEWPAASPAPSLAPPGDGDDEHDALGGQPAPQELEPEGSAGLERPAGSAEASAPDGSDGGVDGGDGGEGQWRPAVHAGFARRGAWGQLYWSVS